MSKFFYHFTRDLTLLLPRLGAQMFYDGLEHVPRTGPALLVANHISHFDPSFMGTKFPRYIHYMADKIFLQTPVLGWLLRQGYAFPIDRSKTDRTALRTVMAKLAAGHVVGIFPERGIRHGTTSILNGAELPVGTAALWKMTNVPVIPLVVLGTDQLYDWKNIFRRPRRRIFLRVGPVLPPDKEATREELRDRMVTSLREIYATILRDYQVRPEELPVSAQERWGRPAPAKDAVSAEN